MDRNDTTAMLDVASRAMSERWGPTTLELLDPIRTGWGRHDLILCNVAGPAGTPSTAVVKAPVAQRSALFSEWSVLEWMGTNATLAGRVPALLAGDASLPLIVIGDVGAGPSLKRLQQVAGAGWAATVDDRVLTADLHVATRGRRAELQRVRARLPSGPETTTATIPIDTNAIVAEFGRWGVPVGTTMAAEIDDMTKRLSVDDGRSCLLLNDACPVNRIATSRGLVAIDFEHASFGHAALDAAFPAIGHLGCSTRLRPDERVAWPMPTRVAAEAVYRDRAVGGYPEWRDERFEHELAAATVVWLATLLGRVADRVAPDDRMSPSRIVARSRVLSLLDASAAVHARTGAMSEVGAWSAELRRRCEQRWPGVEPLPEVAGLSPSTAAPTDASTAGVRSVTP